MKIVDKKAKLMNCMICKLSIDISKEHYLCLREFRGTKEVAVSYYHANCFREKFLIQGKMSKMIEKQMEMVNKAMNNS